MRECSIVQAVMKWISENPGEQGPVPFVQLGVAAIWARELL